jgi:hypothetical protein
MKKVENQEKKKKLLQQIGKYTTAAGAVLLTGNLANAATQLTTVTFNIDYNSHGIDFDGDGNFEVFINGSSWSSSWSSTSSSGNWAFIEEGTDSGAQYIEVLQDGPYANDKWDPAALPLNHLIGPTLAGSSEWSDSFSATLMSTNNSLNDGDGNFDLYPNQIRYVGIRFSSDEINWHYGWIGVRANPLPYPTGDFGQVINYAYETTPNTEILAGGATAVPVLPIASALGLGLVGLFGFIRNRRKKNNV